METLTKDFSTGAIVWYNLKAPCNILYLYSGRQDDSVCSFLKGRVCVNSCSMTQLKDLKSVGRGYDYIVGIDILEESKSPVELLKQCHKLLSPAGRLLLGTENRYAIKNICGDRDPYTNHSFDGIENYRRLSDADSVFLVEQFLYTDLIKNGMFHKLANAYIIDGSLDGAHDDTLHATNFA